MADLEEQAIDSPNDSNSDPVIPQAEENPITPPPEITLQVVETDRASEVALPIGPAVLARAAATLELQGQYAAYDNHLDRAAAAFWAMVVVFVTFTISIGTAIYGTTKHNICDANLVIIYMYLVISIVCVATLIPILGVIRSLTRKLHAVMHVPHTVRGVHVWLFNVVFIIMLFMLALVIVTFYPRC